MPTKIITNSEKLSDLKEIISDVKDASRSSEIVLGVDEGEDGIRSEI